MQHYGAKTFQKSYFCVSPTEDRRSITNFDYCSLNNQSGLQINTFLKLSYFFNTSKCAASNLISYELYDGFICEKILSYEGRKVGHSALDYLPI